MRERMWQLLWLLCSQRNCCRAHLSLPWNRCSILEVHRPCAASLGTVEQVLLCGQNMTCRTAEERRAGQGAHVNAICLDKFLISRMQITVQRYSGSRQPPAQAASATTAATATSSSGLGRVGGARGGRL